MERRNIKLLAVYSRKKSNPSKDIILCIKTGSELRVTSYGVVPIVLVVVLVLAIEKVEYGKYYEMGYRTVPCTPEYRFSVLCSLFSVIRLRDMRCGIRSARWPTLL